MSSVYQTAIDLKIRDDADRVIMRMLQNMEKLDDRAKKVGAAISAWGKARSGSGAIGGEAGELERMRKEAAKAERAFAKWSGGISAANAALETTESRVSGVASMAASATRHFRDWRREIAAAERGMREMREVRAPRAPNAGSTVPRAEPRAHGGQGGHGARVRFGHGAIDLLGANIYEPTLVAGAALGHATHDLLHAGGELNAEVSRYRMSGASRENVEAGVRASYSTTAQVPTVGVSHNFEMLREVAGETGDDAGAREILPDLARARTVLASATGKSGKDDMLRLFKFIGLRGGAIDEEHHKIDVGKFRAELHSAVKALVAGQGLVTSNDLQQFIKQAGPMAKGMSADDMFATVLASIEDMGGARTGTALTAVGRQVFGGIMTPDIADHWAKLGMFNYAEDGKGAGWARKKGKKGQPGKLWIQDPRQAVKGYDVLDKEGIGAWIEKVARPAMESHGIKDRNAQNKELYQFASTETARRIMGLFLSSPEQIEAVRQRYHQAMGVDGYGKVLEGGDYNTSAKALSESMETLKTSLSNAEGVAPMLMSLAKGIAATADAAKNHPALGTAATFGLGGASAGMMGFGAYKVLTGFGLPAAAAQLSTAAVHLEAAALKIAGGGPAADAAKEAAKSAPAAGLLTALGLTGIGIGTAAGAAFAGYATAQAMPKIAAEEGPGAVDPGTGEHLATAIPETTPWLRNLIQSKIDGWLGSSGAVSPPLDREGRRGQEMLRRDNATSGGGGTSLQGAPPAGGTLQSEGGPGAGAAAAQIRQGSEAISAAGQAAAGAQPNFVGAAGGINQANQAASAAPGAFSALAGAISNFIASVGRMGASVPSGGGGAAAAPVAPAAPKPSAGLTPAPRSQAPVHVATTVQLDGRTVGRAVTRHQVASMNTRNGTGRFDSNGLKTPVGLSEPVTA